MLKIGIVGIGNICQKAYLPYMRQLKEVEWHLFTRNQTVLKEVDSFLYLATLFLILVWKN